MSELVIFIMAIVVVLGFVSIFRFMRLNPNCEINLKFSFTEFFISLKSNNGYIAKRKIPSAETHKDFSKKVV